MGQEAVLKSEGEIGIAFLDGTLVTEQRQDELNG